MDKMIHMSLHTLDIALRKQAISAQNMSNMNVTGFRRDVYESFGSLYLQAEDQLDSGCSRLLPAVARLMKNRDVCAPPSCRLIWLLMVQVFCVQARRYGCVVDTAR